MHPRGTQDTLTGSAEVPDGRDFATLSTMQVCADRNYYL
jgi:hypothetical protein